MSWLLRLLGLGSSGAAPVTTLANATREVAEVFTVNKTRKMELGAEAQAAAMAQFAAEFRHAPSSLFDSVVNGVSRLPRPLMALGTLWLFIEARVNPESFTETMTALATVPEPLWWLLGAIISFYFGARESFHWRSAKSSMEAWRAARPVAEAAIADTAQAPEPDTADEEVEDNAALLEWKAKTKGQ